MLAGSIPRAKRRKKLIIGVITTCGSTCTLIHMMSHRICQVCIIGPTVIAWAYQFIGMLPASMCYTGSPCGTLKCTLLAVVPTSFFMFSCCTMPSAQCVVWTGILVLMHTPGNMGCGGVAEHFLLDPRIPLPIPEPSPCFGVTPTPSFRISPAPSF